MPFVCIYAIIVPVSQHSIAPEGLREALRASGESISGMCHDLRTPLNIIIGFAELMLDEVPGPVNKDQRQCLQDILNSSRRLLELLNTITESDTKAREEP